jgi:hypothetical protein
MDRIPLSFWSLPPLSSPPDIQNSAFTGYAISNPFKHFQVARQEYNILCLTAQTEQNTIIRCSANTKSLVITGFGLLVKEVAGKTSAPTFLMTVSNYKLQTHNYTT